MEEKKFNIQNTDWIHFPLEEFINKLNALLEDEKVLEQEEFWQQILDALEQEDQVKYTYLLYTMVGKQIQRAVKSGIEFDIDEMMDFYVRTGRAFYETLFRPECFEKEKIKWMPLEAQYNDILFRFLDGKKKDLSLLLEAAKLRPNQAMLMKAWLSEIGKEIKSS